MNTITIASNFEYRHRHIIIILGYALAYACYNLDHLNALYAVMPSHLGVQQKDLIVRLLYSAATVTAAASAILLTAATAYRPDGTSSKRNHLQIDGPFRYVRNPHYLGYFLLLTALGTFQSRLGLPVMLMVETVFLVRLMGHEEMLLERKYREFFVHYRQAVPRIIPSLRARIKASREVPLWRLAFWKNAFQWACVITLLAFAATLSDSVGYAFTAIAIAIGVVSRLTNLFPPTQYKPK
ncbi:isoprenylcysteine carboxylmethyltransferase family protein [Acidobacterium sp. S8]|uniref:methyltransferase family protein n=1 Tax=Acidobacterium sp. S8 TaxID=1641854 RepID=UPI00131B8A8C|nr:methyltransferase [Acidobacterium sp. S8]